VHLLFGAAITFFSEVLKQFDIADGCVCYAGFKIFAELVINNKNPIIPSCTNARCYAFEEIDNIEPEKWIKNLYSQAF